MSISYVSTFYVPCVQRKCIVCGIDCASNKYMNRYLKKRHDYNRFNYCHLSFNVLAPKVLLILPFLQTKSEDIPTWSYFLLIVFLWFYFFVSFITLIMFCIWWSNLCLPASVLRWNSFIIDTFLYLFFSLCLQFKWALGFITRSY